MKLVNKSAIGDLVKTLENGLQPIRFIYRRKVRSYRAARPMVFDRRVMGGRPPSVVSQHHGSLVSRLPAAVQKRVGVEDDYLMKTHFMVDAKQPKDVAWLDEVAYFLLMFNGHELLFCNDSVSENRRPHLGNLNPHDAMREKLLGLFSEIAIRGGARVRSKTASRNVHPVSK